MTYWLLSMLKKLNCNKTADKIYYLLKPPRWIRQSLQVNFVLKNAVRWLRNQLRYASTQYAWTRSRYEVREKYLLELSTLTLHNSRSSWHFQDLSEKGTIKYVTNYYAGTGRMSAVHVRLVQEFDKITC